MKEIGNNFTLSEFLDLATDLKPVIFDTDTGDRYWITSFSLDNNIMSFGRDMFTCGSLNMTVKLLVYPKDEKYPNNLSYREVDGLLVDNGDGTYKIVYDDGGDL